MCVDVCLGNPCYPPQNSPSWLRFLSDSELLIPYCSPQTSVYLLLWKQHNIAFSFSASARQGNRWVSRVRENFTVYWARWQTVVEQQCALKHIHTKHVQLTTIVVACVVSLLHCFEWYMYDPCYMHLMLTGMTCTVYRQQSAFWGVIFHNCYVWCMFMQVIRKCFELLFQEENTYKRQLLLLSSLLSLIIIIIIHDLYYHYHHHC